MPFVPDAPAAKGQFVPDQEDPGLLGNAYENAKRVLNPKNIVEGAASQIKEGAYDLPIDLHQTLAQLVGGAVTGKDPGQTPMGARMQNIAQSEEVQHPGEWAYKNPIDATMQAATVAAPFMPEASTLQSGLNEGATRASRFAQEQSIKSLEGAIGQVRQVGPEEARALGQMALDKGIVSPFTPTTLGMERALRGELGKAGEAIGSARSAADFTGASPDLSSMIGKIQKELEPKYASGMRSGEMGSLEKALSEVSKLQKVQEIPQEIPDSAGATKFTQTEPNPLYTPVPETIQVQNPIGQPPIPGFEKMPAWYQDKLRAEQASSAPVFEYKNPMYLSDQPLLSKTSEIPRAGYEDFRALQDKGELTPEYNVTEPTFSDVAQKVTEMNQYATGNKMLQPTGAFTDVANSLSRENNAALQQALTPEQWTAYQNALHDYAGLSDIQKFFSRGEARELAGRGSGPVTDLYKGAKDVIGHKFLAAAADTFAKTLSSPAVAKALPTLVNAAKMGPAALETSHAMLQKHDPEYASATQGTGTSTDETPAPDTPGSIVGRVTSDPDLAPWSSLFEEAARRGPQAVIANHFTLMQKDPDYNQAVLRKYTPPLR